MDGQPGDGLPDHVSRNRSAWDRLAREFVEPGRRAWKQSEPTWGIWNIPEGEAHLLPEQVSGLDVIELGVWDSLRLGLACTTRGPCYGD